MKALFLGKRVVIADCSSNPSAETEPLPFKTWFLRRPTPADYICSAERIIAKRPDAAFRRAHAAAAMPGALDRQILESHRIMLSIAIASKREGIHAVFRDARIAVRKALKNSGQDAAAVAVCADIYLAYLRWLCNEAGSPGAKSHNLFTSTLKGASCCRQALAFASGPKIEEGDPHRLNERIMQLCTLSRLFSSITCFEDFPVAVQPYRRLLDSIRLLDDQVSAAAERLPPEMAAQVRHFEPTNFVFHALL